MFTCLCEEAVQKNNQGSIRKGLAHHIRPPKRKWGGKPRWSEGWALEVPWGRTLSPPSVTSEKTVPPVSPVK